MITTLKKYALLCLIIIQVVSCQNRVLVEADNLERNGELEKAELLLTRHLEAYPDDAAVYFHLGELHARMRHFDGMLQDFAKAEQRDSRLRDKVATSKEYHWRESLNRGVAALNRHEPRQAITPLRQAMLILPERHASYPLLAAALIATSDSSGATALLEKACALDENDVESRHALLQIYYASGRHEQALRLSDEILKKSSTDIPALRSRAWVLQRQSPEQAESAFRELLKQSNDTDDMLEFAMYDYRRQQYEQAMVLFQEALERRRRAANAPEATLPASANNHFRIEKRKIPTEEIFRYLGDCAWHVEDYAAMLQWYTRLLQVYPNDLTALQNLLIAAQARGRFDYAELIKKKLEQITNNQE